MNADIIEVQKLIFTISLTGHLHQLKESTYILYGFQFKQGVYMAWFLMLLTDSLSEHFQTYVPLTADC